MKRKALGGTTWMLVLLLAMCFGCGRQSGLGDCRVGVLLPASGQHQKLGETIRESISLAESALQMNRLPSESVVKFLFRDTEGSPDVARRQYTDLVGPQRVVAVLGSILSSDTKGFIQEVEKNAVVVLANGSSAPDLRGASRFFFRNWPADDYEGIVMAQYSHHDLNLKRMAILYADDPYPRGITRAFKERTLQLGGVVLADEAYREGQTNFDAVLRKILEQNPDAIYAAGFPAELGNIARVLRNLNTELPLLSAVGIDVQEFYTVAADAADNILYTAPSLQEGAVPYVKFKQQYSEAFGHPPDIVAAVSYDAAMLLGLAAQQCKCDRAGLLERLMSFKDYPGVSGTTTFDAKGDVHKPISLKRIEKTKTYVIEVLKPTRGSTD